MTARRFRGAAPRSRGVVLALSTLALVGCASTRAQGGRDPLEGFNRVVFAFNDAVDCTVLSPLSTVYVNLVPRLMRTGVSNFLDNLTYPTVFLNGFLQGKWGQGGRDTLRFLINSTLGVAGLFDVATGMGFGQHEEDLGQTLAVWGVGEGPYLVLPVLGPSTFRDAPGIAFDNVASIVFFVDVGGAAVPLVIVSAADRRSRADEGIEMREREALDPYVFTREAYRQRRLFLIHDGNPPLSALPGAEDEDDLGLDLGEVQPL